MINNEQVWALGATYNLEHPAGQVAFAKAVLDIDKSYAAEQATQKQFLQEMLSPKTELDNLEQEIAYRTNASLRREIAALNEVIVGLKSQLCYNKEDYVLVPRKGSQKIFEAMYYKVSRGFMDSAVWDAAIKASEDKK